jgi:predicted nucleic acid-binding protein
LIPQAVHKELLQAQTPLAVRNWVANLPAWCEERLVIAPPDPALDELDPGEREAIQLAAEAGVDTVLMDDAAGRREAARRHLRVIGTLGILEQASQKGLVEFRDALQRLERTNFRLSAAVRDEFLRRNP